MMRPRGRAPILIVEDDPVLREALTLVLEAEGHTVIGAAEGQQALDIRGALRTRPFRDSLDAYFAARLVRSNGA